MPYVWCHQGPRRQIAGTACLNSLGSLLGCLASGSEKTPVVVDVAAPKPAWPVGVWEKVGNGTRLLMNGANGNGCAVAVGNWDVACPIQTV